MNGSQKPLRLTRYPHTDNKSLKAISAADEHLLQHLDSVHIQDGPLIFNDRFGALTCHLHHISPQTVISYRSQEKAVLMNLEANGLPLENVGLFNPLELLPKTKTVLIRVPKSMDLFKLYLHRVMESLEDDGEVICAFMTRHFSPQLLEIGSTYFESVEQSLAWKKSRLLILRNKKEYPSSDLIHGIPWENGLTFQQYYGVFSAQHIDFASQFFIPHIKVEASDSQILDLASGSGILAHTARQLNPSATIHLMDDSFLAVSSGQLNLGDHNVLHHYNDTLAEFKDELFDLVISNPPFHFEYETNIEVTLSLFKDVHRCLKPDGRFQLVANRHLNYQSHLKRIFSIAEITGENEKFVVCEAKK